MTPYEFRRCYVEHGLDLTKRSPSLERGKRQRLESKQSSGRVPRSLWRDRLVDAFAAQPAVAVHVEPFAFWFAGVGVGAEAQDVTIEVFDLHFQRP